MSLTATARRVGGTLRHEIDVNGRHSIVTDEPFSLGGTDEGPTPHELLPAALAGCISTMISMYAEKRGWEIGEVSAHVDYDPEQTPRRVAVTVHLPEGLSSDQRQRLSRVAETCPVRRALETGFRFSERVVSAPHGAPAAGARSQTPGAG